MTHEQKAAACEGLLEISLISSLILRLANSAINGTGAIEGPELAWLVGQLDRAETGVTALVEGVAQ
jgi:hypothetical protein